VVLKGDVLVSCTIENEVDGEKKVSYVQPVCKVLGRCYYNVHIEQDLNLEVKHFTNRKHYELEIVSKKGHSIKVLEYEGDYSNYIKQERVFKINGITIKCNLYKEYVINTETISQSYAISSIKNCISRNLKHSSNKIYEVIYTNLKFYKSNNKLIASGEIETIEDIRSNE